MFDTMKKILLIIALGLNFGNLVSQTTYSKEVEAQIEQVENNLAGRVKLSAKGYNIKERMAYYKLKGLSLAVVHNYQVVWAKGYGWADEAEKRPVTVNTLFQAASNSKSINAMGVLKLVQDKKLDLYTDINFYLKSWQFPYDSLSKNKKITLANLLSHTAGLSVHGFPGYDRKAQLPTITQILDGKAPANTAAVRSEFEPGLKSKYSGGGTTISKLVIMDVTGQPYDKFMYDNVLKPLGMINSFFTQPPPADKLNMLATGYYVNGSEVPHKFHVYPEQAPDGLWTTPTEMCKYIIETQLAYAGRSSKVLTPEMTKLSLTPYIDKIAALGVFVEERGTTKYFQHGAGNEGFCGQYYASVEGGDGVVVYVNSDNRSIIQEVINSVATVYKWKDFYDATVKSEVTVPESVLAKYTGVYMFDDVLTAIFKKEDGYYYLSDNVYAKMYFTTEKSFFNEEFQTEKTFLMDTAGNVTGFSRQINGKFYPTAVKVTDVGTLKVAPGQINNMGWYLLENKQYNTAIAFFKKGILLDPKDVAAIGNLGHAYLFNNEYDKAIAQYKEFLSKVKELNPELTNMISNDFITFKSMGFDRSLMDKVFTDLKIKKPKGY